MPLESSNFEILVEVDLDEMKWPEEGPVAHGIDNNRSYEDLTRARWSDVDKVIEEENRLLDRIALLTEAEREKALELAQEEFTTPEELGVHLDLGVAAATMALNVARCPTITACSGHVAGYPYVAFWSRRNRVAILSRIAREASVGLGNAERGALEVYAPPNDLRAMVRFAARMREASVDFRLIRSDRPKPTITVRSTGSSESQLSLTLDEDDPLLPSDSAPRNKKLPEVS